MGHRREIMYNGMALNDCANRIRYCIQRLGWSFRGEGPGVIYAGVSISLRSYGENVRFAFFRIASLSRASVRSRSNSLIGARIKKTLISSFRCIFTAETPPHHPAWLMERGVHHQLNFPATLAQMPVGQMPPGGWRCCNNATAAPEPVQLPVPVR